MVVPTVELVNIMSKYTKDVFEYHFSLTDSFHSAELNYVFGAPFSGIYADEMNQDTEQANHTTVFTQADRNLSVRIMQLWSHIATTGYCCRLQMLVCIFFIA